eukprot:8814405-Pyramimonas_sp.AAC.1
MDQRALPPARGQAELGQRRHQQEDQRHRCVPQLAEGERALADEPQLGDDANVPGALPEVLV